MIRYCAVLCYRLCGAHDNLTGRLTHAANSRDGKREREREEIKPIETACNL